MTNFDGLNLSAHVLRNIDAQGFTTPTAIQSQTIPHLMEGRDVMGLAETGGGKTAAFLIPIIERLIAKDERSQAHKPEAVILAPTRELACQIGDAIRLFTRGIKIHHTVVYGGAPYRTQLRDLQRGVHILVATPGRLMDLVARNCIIFDNAETLVLDEADRMLDMGFIDEVTEVSKALPKDHQTVMFSATMGKNIDALARNILNNPTRVDTPRKTMVASTIDHRVLFVTGGNKRALLKGIIEQEASERTIVFVRTKHGADKLTDDLVEAGIQAQAIHGDKPQAQRQRTLRGFRSGRFAILVATDVAARGIDVPDISHVINYDLPMEPENYIHRVGRTGRAGAEGVAISLCEVRELPLLRSIEQELKQPVRVDREHLYHIEPPKARQKQGKNGGRGAPTGAKVSYRKFGGKSNAKPGAGKFNGGKSTGSKFEGKSEGYKGKSENYKGKSEGFKGKSEGNSEGFKGNSEGFKGKSEGFKGKSDSFKVSGSKFAGSKARRGGNTGKPQFKKAS